MDWSGGWGAAGAFAMMVGMLVLAALAVAGLALIFRPVFGKGNRAPAESSGGERTQHGPASTSIEERYARGEISRDEFLGLRRGLVEGDPHEHGRT
jgi:uncharacterized membrane protein